MTTTAPAASSNIQMIEIIGAFGLLSFLCILILVVYFKPHNEDGETPIFVWVGGAAILITVCTLFAAAGLPGFG